MTQDVLNAYGPIGVQILKTNVSRVGATGKTVDSIRYEVQKDRLLLIGRGYFSALETGRGPRTSSQDGGFKSGLDEWLQARSFPSKVSKSGTKYYQIGNQWFSARSLAWKINKEGDKLWKKGHGAMVRDVYSSALDRFVMELTDKVVKDKMDGFIKKVTDTLKMNSNVVISS